MGACSRGCGINVVAGRVHYSHRRTQLHGNRRFNRRCQRGDPRRVGGRARTRVGRVGRRCRRSNHRRAHWTIHGPAGPCPLLCLRRASTPGAVGRNTATCARARVCLDARPMGMERWSLGLEPGPMGADPSSAIRLGSGPLGTRSLWLVLATRPLGVALRSSRFEVQGSTVRGSGFDFSKLLLN